LINVGLSASATGNCSPILQLAVYSNEDDVIPGSADSPDAKDIASGTLRLRAERDGNGNGRVYLIVATALDTNVGYAVATVVVPKNDSQAAADAVNVAAAAAATYALGHSGNPPPGYSLVGDGPVLGPKQ